MHTPPQGSSFGDPPGDPPDGRGQTQPGPFGQGPQGPTPGPYRAGPSLEPNRGALVLTLGIFSIVAPIFAGLCCLPVGMIGVAFGIPAILMGRADMRKYAAGTMDPTGYSSTQAGYICGIIGCVIAALEGLATLFVLVLYGSFFGLALFGAASQGGF